MTLIIPQITATISSETKLVLKLFLRNLTEQILLFRPTVDDWVIDETEIISTNIILDPFYINLYPQGEIIQKINIQLPLNLKPGQKLKNWVRFPAIQEEAIPINLEVVSSTNPNHKPEFIEVSLPMTIPLFIQVPSSSNQPVNSSTDGVNGLMSGIMDLDKIPSRWVVAELLVKLCQLGEEYGQSVKGLQLFKELRRTSFFDNGVKAFSAAKIPVWIAQTLSTIKATLPCPQEERHLLYIWEKWLFNLTETDLESDQNSEQIKISSFLAEEFVNKLEMSSELWFKGIVLGLAKLSPKIETTLKQIAIETTPMGFLSNNILVQSSINLSTGLLGFDVLPARWLVVEILLILAQSGDKYAQTEEGKILFSRLARTRFFKNGILALASVQIPRWLDISESASSAYYTSVGVQTGNKGLLYLWEMWLWNLAPTELKLKQINSEILDYNATARIFINELGMDCQRWFTSILLGLAQISPRIKHQIQEIADKIPENYFELKQEKSLPKLTVNDVIGEKGSIQR